ncbi:dethiobiotin synthetase [Paractinoplanes brasiliensis]|uniref:ATP-dependent dethiobiotin synthetase BioD n=1 Tax=Paractinoplanes brasiliensis TaxID=52695 RepID=A0A4R6JVY7_9ACTN|nr:dethiobiotin synthetase [Actinoplanes brasiliensis]
MTPTSVNLSALLTRLPAATVVWTVRERHFTHRGFVDPQGVLTPVELDALTTLASPAVAGTPLPTQRATETVPPADHEPSAGISLPAESPSSVPGSVEPPGQAISAPPAEPEPVAPTPPAPISPAPDAPVQPAPETPAGPPSTPGHPLPVTPAPVSPAPGHPLPATPAPVSPAPGHPLPATPAPVSPAPGHPLPDAPTPDAPVPAPDADELPSAESIGAEVSAELAAQAPTSAQPAPRRPAPGEWRGIVLVTGTDTDVGKTIVTAAVAAAAQASGLRVAVIKPGQTGINTGAPTDIDVITRLAAPDTTRTLAEYPEPMAPLAAATVAQLPPLELYEVVDAIRAEADKHDLVLVEGAGGLLVPMGVRPSGESWTVADLATTLGLSTIVVARAGLGTLNHTALTLEALARRGVPAGVVIGAWPADPDLVHWANLSELVPHLIGALPEGAGAMDPGVFRRSAPGWLTPGLYGDLENWRVWAEESGDGHH